MFPSQNKDAVKIFLHCTEKLFKNIQHFSQNKAKTAEKGKGAEFVNSFLVTLPESANDAIMTLSEYRLCEQNFLYARYPAGRLRLSYI